MRRRRLLLLCVFSLAGLLSLLCAKPAAAAVPEGYEDGPVADIGGPTALAFTPDGRMLVTTKTGKLFVHKDGALLPSPALDLSGVVCANSERGLLGVAVDPEFASGGYVYLYYTRKVGSTCDGSRDEVNQVSRFAMSGNVADPASEEILVDNIPSPNGNHNAGDLHFGKDGYLYASVGDGGCYYAAPSLCQYENGAARERHTLLGKILRVDRDGGIPPDNPYTGSGSARCNVTGRTAPGNVCQETFAMGLRNPFRMAFDPDAAGGATSFRINDVGGQNWEEIDAGKKGADYGWNVCEGLHDNPYRAGSVSCSAAPLTPPIHEYNHNTGCESITGAAFVPDAARWPASYKDTYLFGDYVCGKIFGLAPKAGGGLEKTLFASGLGPGGPVAMAFGPDGALYYTTFAGGGQVRRIAYTVGNRAPTADIAADRTYGPEVPMPVSFSGAGSSDPDGDPLTYEWDFTSDGTADATGPEASHAYEQAGKYTATLTVRDDRGGEDTATIEVFPGYTLPEPVIEAPKEGTTFRVGEELTATGSATDAEDPAAPTLEWEVLQHHDGNHTHPLASGTGGSVSFPGPSPEGLYSTDPEKNYLEVRLTATDSQGLSKTVTRELKPKTVDVGFATRPTGLKLTINGQAIRAPQTLVSWEGYALNVEAYRQKGPRGRTYVFVSWSDGGAARHTIETSGAPAPYTATFKRRR